MNAGNIEQNFFGGVVELNVGEFTYMIYYSL